VDYQLFVPTSVLLSSRVFDPMRELPRFKALMKKVKLDQFSNDY